MIPNFQAGANAFPNHLWKGGRTSQWAIEPLMCAGGLDCNFKMSSSLAYNRDYALNAICPYFTMFPLEYPMRILRNHKAESPIVLDPFCGRGTTIFAARKLGIEAYGMDASPVAAAIARAKLATTSEEKVIALAAQMIGRGPRSVPDTTFFKLAFAPQTLRELCSIREGLLRLDHETNESVMLRAAALGCLHGPRSLSKAQAGYFSNQMPRTFASKPDYSVRFWRRHRLSPPVLSTIAVLQRKLKRIGTLDKSQAGPYQNIGCADSRRKASFRRAAKPSLIITSPPYYGMRTYVQDQWLRNWFLGGPEKTDYENDFQLSHNGKQKFIRDLAKVWKNCWSWTDKKADLYIRFGTIPSVKSDAREILKSSLAEAGGWDLVSIRRADTASAGKRQANQMIEGSDAAEEYDFHAVST